MQLTGGCLCGAVRYTSTGAHYRRFVCHCSDCKRSGGSAFHIGIAVPRTDFTITSGELRAYMTKEDSGRTVTRSFCPNCGSGVFNEPEAWPDHVGIKVGTLDHPAAVLTGNQRDSRSSVPSLS